MDKIIEIHNLSKSFGSVKAVQNISFEVKSGEFFAFLGINGAGKSTTIDIMCSILEKDSGEVIIDGENIDKNPAGIKNKIGVVFQKSVLDSALTVKDNLLHRASLYGIFGDEFIKKLNMLSSLLDFEHLLNRTVGKLSGGERRRIDIARALLHSPKILILDEPTTGLDPKTRKTLWNVISTLRKSSNMTVFLTTHYMEEASDADYIVILDSGKIVASGSPLELKNKYADDYLTLYNVTEEQVKSLEIPYYASHDAYKIPVESTAKIRELIIKNPALFSDFEVTKGRMDDVFLSATGKSLYSISEAEIKGGKE